MSVSAWLGKHLRFFADRIDPENAPRLTGMSFTFEQGIGIVFHQGGTRGCPIAYLSASDYDRAHTEALPARIQQQEAKWESSISHEALAPLRAKHQRVQRPDGSYRCTSCRDSYGYHADWPTGTDRLIYSSEELS